MSEVNPYLNLITQIFTFYKKNASESLEKKVALHLLFWVLLLELGLIFNGQLTPGLSLRKGSLFLYTCIYLTNILFYYFFVRQNKKHEISTLALFIIWLFLLNFFYYPSILLGKAIYPESTYFDRYLEQLKPTKVFNFKAYFANALDHGFYTALLPFTIIIFYKYWLRQETFRNLTNRKIELELNNIKSQLNPDLIFASLETLKSEVSNQPEVLNSVNKLSNLFSYSTQEINKDFVLLSSEIQFLTEYIDLARLRLNEKKTISFKADGDFDSLKIIPLVLITFVENAVKHGLNITNNTSWVEVELRVAENKLFFCCRNSNHSPNKAQNTNGIGLKNTQKRLSYYYPKKHKLTILNQDNIYSVNLELTLDPV
ncbi:sensor histidine kinase [Jiulongibacter sp. NS-SX5]|uniref:sensor histidine kinase n=1 Tax=Jiulongibacter sp. NS-SX5 TaxID=3463854 RepID=UPI0040595644